MNKEIKQRFCQQLGNERVRFEEPMCDHTTFRIGGPAEVFVMPDSYEQIAWVIRQCCQEAIPYFILGNGSNLLVSDEGYCGVIIQLYRNYGGITVEGTNIRAGAGALLSQIASAAKNASLTGFEFAGGIPGTLGGAVVMNAGAYGGEMKNVLKEVTVMTEQGEIMTIPAEKLDDFVGGVKDASNVRTFSESTEDVTLQYTDMDTHIKALREELDALFSMMEQATSMKDILSIQSQITDVRYEIESYESQLRVYDNQVTYSTVYLDLYEVNRESSTTGTTFGERVKAKFNDNMYQMGQGFQNFMVGLLGGLPILLPIVVICVVVVVVLRKIWKKRKNDKQKKEEE